MHTFIMWLISIINIIVIVDNNNFYCPIDMKTFEGKRTGLYFYRMLDENQYVSDISPSQNAAQGHFIVGTVHELKLMHCTCNKYLTPSAFPYWGRGAQTPSNQLSLAKQVKPKGWPRETTCPKDIQPPGMNARWPARRQVNENRESYVQVNSFIPRWYGNEECSFLPLVVKCVASKEVNTYVSVKGFKATKFVFHQ